MIFENFSLKEKLIMLLLLLLLLCSWLGLFPGTCSASGTPQTYTITVAELQGLDSRLERLGQLSETQRLESMRLRDTLTRSEQELQTLKSRLNTSTAQLEQAQSSLLSANQLLEQYAAAAKKERLRIKAQRNTWLAVALVAATVAIIR